MINTTSNKKAFPTDNFSLAIFLKTKGCALLYISKIDIRHATFNFEDTPEREKLTREFWNGKALVEPRSFYSNQRELKSFLYDNSYPKTLKDT